ncbi:hypothetical protein BCV70DRAFT_204050 [Testicularia cyperi]|uniref:Uncharacterized protein n=1 Tax=Testicularia cyperi TaxID=1882483 RepID=A0A317XYN7_9BASI|nr:hypothetical protein BCV70DRAFT_204050 [Testicularia cyperi]
MRLCICSVLAISAAVLSASAWPMSILGNGDAIYILDSASADSIRAGSLGSPLAAEALTYFERTFSSPAAQVLALRPETQAAHSLLLESYKDLVESLSVEHHTSGYLLRQIGPGSYSSDNYLFAVPASEPHVYVGFREFPIDPREPFREFVPAVIVYKSDEVRTLKIMGAFKAPLNWIHAARDRLLRYEPTYRYDGRSYELLGFNMATGAPFPP